MFNSKGNFKKHHKNNVLEDPSMFDCLKNSLFRRFAIKDSKMMESNSIPNYG